MNVQRHAIVLTDDASDFAEWGEVNQGWLDDMSRAFHCSPEGEAPKDMHGQGVTDAACRLMAPGFLLTRPDWRVDRMFGALAAAGGFALATGRLMSRKTNQGEMEAYNDIAPYLIADDIEQFSISATYDGFLCRKLPLECIWVGASIAPVALSLLIDGEPASEVVEVVTGQQKLAGGVRQAYLSDMKALWRRAGDARACATFQGKA